LNAGDEATVSYRHRHAVGIETLSGDCRLDDGLEARKY
jgi:hypothetical protein